MRPVLIRIPLDFWPAYALWILLLSLVLIGGYIIWVWIYQKKTFPENAALLLLLLTGASIFALVKPESFPKSLPIYSYGFMMMLGFGGGIWLTAYRAKKVGISPEVIYDLAVYIILGGLIGARLFYVFVEAWDEFATKSWLEILKVWKGGLTFYGGVIGGAVASLLFVYVRKLDGLLLSDLLAPSLMLGLGFGRLGCMLNGCCWGKVAEDTILPTITWKKGSLCYLFQLKQGLIPLEATHSLPVYFTQLYSSLLAFALCGLILLFSRYWQKRKGSAFALMLFLYSIERFLIEYLRADNPPRYLGGHFTVSQVVSMVGMAIALALFVYVFRRNEPVSSANRDVS